MQTLKVTQQHLNGEVLMSTRINDQVIRMRYNGYTDKEATKQFLKHVKEVNSKNFYNQAK